MERVNHQLSITISFIDHQSSILQTIESHLISLFQLFVFICFIHHLIVLPLISGYIGLKGHQLIHRSPPSLPVSRPSLFHRPSHRTWFRGYITFLRVGKYFGCKAINIIGELDRRFIQNMKLKCKRILGSQLHQQGMHVQMICWFTREWRSMILLKAIQRYGILRCLKTLSFLMTYH